MDLVRLGRIVTTEILVTDANSDTKQKRGNSPVARENLMIKLIRPLEKLMTRK